MVGPINFLSESIRLIQNETEHAKAGRTASITAKMNALIDPDIIQALYQASQAGVKHHWPVSGA